MLGFEPANSLVFIKGLQQKVILNQMSKKNFENGRFLE